MAPKSGQKIKISKICCKRFLTIFYSNLTKYQVPRSIFAHSIKENVISRYRDFNLRDPFWAKIGLFSLIISQNPKNFTYFVVQNKTWRYMKNHQKPGLKPFLAPENHDFSLFFAHIFLYKLYREMPDFRHTRQSSNANILS